MARDVSAARCRPVIMPVKGVLAYSVTIFLSAFLLFQIQPMIAKMILPWFGGSAAVWITCMVFFQVVLLGGYVYVHLLINRISARMQVVVHGALLLISLFLLPVGPGLHWKPEGGEQPILQILGLLFCSVGLPYFLLSTTSPLVQVWYSASHKVVLPYRLFALSNVASLAGLLAYPFLIEPRVVLRFQSIGWSALYGAFAALCFFLSIGNVKRTSEGKHDPVEQHHNTSVHTKPPPTLRTKALWLALSTCASLLLLSVTNHLTQNIASIPFLWVLPLSLYLLTFIFCFDRSGWYQPKIYVWALYALIGLMAYGLVYWGAGMSLKIVVPVYCAGLFLCCMFCHGELVVHRPPAGYLTAFYLVLSLGGALGGIAVGLLAPNVFTGYFELPVGLLFCSLLILLLNYRRGWIMRGLSSALVIGVIVAGVKCVIDYSDYSLLNSRNFYGVLRVKEYSKGKETEHRSMVHGTINHGIQFTAPDRQMRPLTYYSSTSGVGRAVTTFQKMGAVKVGIIGLGAGSLAAYSRDGDEFRFYEINPTVEALARRYFYYLSGAKGKVSVVIGDGRLSLEREPIQHYDVLAVDAFSGDAIPAHLLTKQSFELYFKHLKPDGILAIHISNKHLKLGLVVEELCKAFGVSRVLIDDEKTDQEEDDEEVFGSDWALVSTNPRSLESPEIKDAVTALPSQTNIRVWTDDYNNIFQILK